MEKIKLQMATALLGMLLATAILLAACGDSTPTANSVQPTPSTVAATATAPTAAATTAPATSAAATTAAPNTTAAAITAPAPTVTPLPAAPTATVAPNATSGATTGATSVEVSDKQYVDDRSDPIAVLRSFYNAINRKEYVRAYSYWNNSNAGSSAQLPAYPQFEQGYTDTASVQLLIGQTLSGAAAGSRYYEVPVTLKSTSTGGTSQNFVGCYVLRQPNPLNFGAPPFQPMSINSATVQSVAANANTAQLMAQNCPPTGGPTPDGSITITPNSGAYDSSNFLDNRSTPEELIRSYYNAINRKEYVRAYAYWSPSAVSTSQLQPYPQFEQGYKTTASVQLTFGKLSSDAGAGQLNYSLPVVVTARQTSDRVQTYVGCYTLHQSQPAIFGAPPFVPLNIAKANLKEVQNANQDLTAQLNQACQAS